MEMGSIAHDLNNGGLRVIPYRANCKPPPLPLEQDFCAKFA
jgi:hypothetical protein